MDAVSKKIVRWPKKPVREIPLESIPGGDIARNYLELTSKAHAEEIRQIKRRLKKSYEKQRIKFMAEFATTVTNNKKR